MKKILLILPTHPSETGFIIGFEREGKLASQFAEVTLCHTLNFNALPAKRILENIPKTITTIMVASVRLFKTRYDYVWVPNIVSIGFYLLLLKKLRIKRFSLIMDIHGLPSERLGYRSYFFERLLWFITKKSDMVWHIDAPELKAFCEKANARSFLVPTPIDTSIYCPNDMRRRLTREKFGLNGFFCIGVIGPFESYYNGPGLKFLLANLDKLPPKSKLLIVGDNGINCAKDDKIIFAGRLDFNDYLDILRAMDCLVIPRFVKTLGPQTKVMECMSTGLPIIQTTMATPPTGFENGKHLFVVENASDIFGLVSNLSDNSQLCKEIGKNARGFIDELYGSKKVKTCLESILHN